MNPADLLYAETHEWVHLEEQDGRKVATIGISDFAVEQLSDLVYMDLPDVGQEVSVGHEFGEVESVKAVSPLYSPVDGTVVAVNDELPNHLDRLNSDPYGEGWIIKVRLNNESALHKLLDHEAYRRQCSAEG
jgi:glycine cleavage system H protein